MIQLTMITASTRSPNADDTTYIYLLSLVIYFQLTWILRNRRKSYPHVQPIHHNQSNRAQSSYLIRYHVHLGRCQNLGGKSSDLILSDEVQGGPTKHETLIDHWRKYGRIISIAPFIKSIEPTSSQQIFKKRKTNDRFSKRQA